MITDEDGLNSIAIDVAVGRVILGAVKARAGVALSQGERDAAGEVGSILREQRKAATVVNSIPPSFILDDDIRTKLEQSLGTTDSARPTSLASPAKLASILTALDAIKRDQCIECSVANELRTPNRMAC